MKILIVHDSSSFAFNLQRYFTGEVNVIYFDKYEVISQIQNAMFFDRNDFVSWVNQIKDLSKKYDLFVCLGWHAAAVCYLAEVNYVMYFVDSYIDPQNRIRKKVSIFIKNFLNDLYKDALDNASVAVASLSHDAKILQKYKYDVRIIFPLVDNKMFNQNVVRKELKSGKFVFLSTQRIDPAKGHQLLWRAVQLTKSEFIVLQTDWGSGDYYNEMLKNKPVKIEMIPKINRQDMPSYLGSMDALLGQISKTSCGSNEREAILCNRPVFCYSPEGFTENDPFYKGSTKPEDIAEYIDKMVLNKEFREQLTLRQNAWIEKTFDNKKIVQQWNEVFEEAIKQKPNYQVRLKYKMIIKLLTITQNLTKKKFGISSIVRTN